MLQNKPINTDSLISGGQDFVQKEIEKAKVDARHQAKADTDNGLPLEQGDSISHYITPIRTNFERIAEDTIARMKLSTLLSLTRAVIEENKDKVKRLGKELDQVRHKLKNLELDIRRTKPVASTKILTFQSLLILIAAFEAYMVKSALLDDTTTTFSHLLSFLGLTVFFWSLPGLLTKIYKLVQNRVYRRLACLALFLSLATVFYVLGSLRSTIEFASSGMSLDGPGKALEYMLINLFMVGTSLYIRSRKTDIEPSQEAKSKRDEHEKERKSLTSRLKELEKQLQAAKKKIREQTAIQEEVLGALHNLLQITRRGFNQTVAIWMQEILQRRTGTPPDCIKEEIPSIQLPTIPNPKTLNS